MNPQIAAPTNTLTAECASPSMEMLSDLRAAHNQLLICVSEMEHVTSELEPNPLRYTGARLRISQASLARRGLVHRIIKHLSRVVSSADAHALQALEATDAQNARQSTTHVSRWTVDAIQADWAGYQKGSLEIRTRIKEGIKAEQQVLYPLLQLCR